MEQLNKTPFIVSVISVEKPELFSNDFSVGHYID